jgi:DNA end-binding protein Ku
VRATLLRMPRAIWKGAVSFGLVYIPVEMYSAARSSTLDLNLLDSRDFSPVGYQRINKRTGKAVDWGDIVKGYEYKKGEYVALSEEDFRQANVKASQTIEITSFASSADITPEYYENPYYLVPTKGGEKGYALLRETLLRTGKVAVGSVVMRGRQHFGVIGADKRVLLFNTLRFAAELRSLDDLGVAAPTSKAANISPKEVAMAEKLLEEMSAPWKPDEYHDTYREDLMRRIEEKVRKHQTHLLTAKEKTPKEGRKSAEVIDLMAVLRKSLESRTAAAKSSAAPRASRSRRRRS